MADPNTPFSERNSNPEGVGPYTFELPELQPGETYTLNLRDRERGRFVVLSPAGYDNATIKNQSDVATIDVLINEATSYPIAPNTEPTIGMSGQYRYDITNTQESGGTVIDAGDVQLTILKEAYGADEAARSRQQEGPIRKVVRHFTGV